MLQLAILRFTFVATGNLANHSMGLKCAMCCVGDEDWQAEQEEDELEGIDPEFIAALPPELQAEVLEQQRRERRARQAAARRSEQQQQQVGVGGNFDV